MTGLAIGDLQRAFQNFLSIANKTLDALTIGSITPAAGTFTTLNATTLNVTNPVTTISALSSTTTATFNAISTTTLSNIPGLTLPVVAGKYKFVAYLPGVATTNGGAQFAIANSGTTTSTSYAGKQYNGATINAGAVTTTMGNAVGNAKTVFTDAYIEGSVVTSTAGNLTVQLAQNTSHADTTSVFAGATFTATRIA